MSQKKVGRVLTGDRINEFFAGRPRKVTVITR